MEQMMELLQDMQENIDAYLKEMKDEIRATNDKFEVLQDTLVSLLDAQDARTEANQEEMMAKLDVHHERLRASVDAWRKGTTACQ
jgi:TolA-binding protein